MSSTSAPVVSVVTVFWNQVRWIDACVQSVLAQQGPAFEWIAIENGSTDGTGQRLDEWARRDSRLKVDHVGENLRQIGGLGRALPQVRGANVALLDGDDLMLPGRLDQSAAWLAAGDERVAVYGGAQFIDDQDRPAERWMCAGDAPAVRALAEFTMPVIHSTGTWKTHMLRRCFRPLTRGDNAFDYYLLTRALEEGDVGWLKGPLGAYRMHPANASRQNPGRQLAYGIAYSLLAAQRRTGFAPDGDRLLNWAENLGRTNVDDAATYAAAARFSVEQRAPRHAIYYARRAIRRGAWSAFPVFARTLWSERRRLRSLWPLLCGGLCGAAGVDARGRSIVPGAGRRSR